jgi:hypothetical protein
MKQYYPQKMNHTILPTSTLATISLIAGILGFMGLPLVASIAAIWTGYAARKDTRANPPRASGDGMATAGIIMGWIQVGIAVAGICCLFAYLIFAAGILGSINNT